MVHRIFAYIKRENNECKALASEFAATNVRRIVYGSAAAMFIHLAYVIIYSLPAQRTTLELQWRGDIATAHIILLALMGTAFLVSLILRGRKKAGLPEYLLQYILVSLLMAEGILLTYFDQLVTPNVTPYIIFCLIVGVAFLIRPVYSLLIFAASYAIFFYAADLRPFLDDVVMSNRMNGFEMAAVGFAISFAMWKYNVMSSRQRAHIKEHHKKLVAMANLDPLTGLFNRRKFDEIIKYEVALSALKQHESSLIMLDIDYFKNINDTYGHPAGDSILVQFSRLLSDNIRKGDSICRLGGEEFIILLPCTTEGEAVCVAEKLRNFIENHIFTAGERSVRLSASFGIARLDYNLDPTLISQYSKVDNALYIAKHNGRNRVIAV